MLAAAKSDLKAVEHMSDPDGFDDRIFGFNAQQAVEKALKAWLHNSYLPASLSRAKRRMPSVQLQPMQGSVMLTP